MRVAQHDEHSTGAASYRSTRFSDVYCEGVPSADTDMIALFPLGTVLVPGQVLPLHVFEPRYRQLVHDLIDAPDHPRRGRSFGVVSIRTGHEVGANSARSLSMVGTAARVQTVEKYDDGRYDMVTVGTDRFEINELDVSAPYLQANVTWLTEFAGESTDPLVASVSEQFVAYRERLRDMLDPIPFDSLPHDPIELSYLVATAMVLDRADRQTLLEKPDSATRLRAELSLLRRESALAVHLPSIPAGDLARSDASLN